MKYGNLILLILSAGSMIGLQGCLRDDVSFVVDTRAEMVIPSGLSPDRNLILDQQVFFPYSVQLDVNNVEEENVESVNGVLGLAFPQFGAVSDLSFISEIEIDVLDPTNTTLSGREIFHYVQRDFRRLSDIDLTPSLPDVKDLIRDDVLLLRIEVSFNIPPPTTFTMLYDLQLGVFEVEEM